MGYQLDHLGIVVGSRLGSWSVGSGETCPRGAANVSDYPRKWSFECLFRL